MSKQLLNTKSLVALAVLVTLGVAGYLTLLHTHHPAKYYAVEPMTATRPARFEKLRWTPEPGVELRAPASKSK